MTHTTTELTTWVSISPHVLPLLTNMDCPTALHTTDNTQDPYRNDRIAYLTPEELTWVADAVDYLTTIHASDHDVRRGCEATAQAVQGAILDLIDRQQ